MHVAHRSWWWRTLTATVVFVGILGALGLGPTEPIQLKSLTPAAQKGYYMRFLKPRPVDSATVARADAIKSAERADPEALPVQEVVLARAHRVDWGPPDDPLCWVIVMAFGQAPPVDLGFVVVLVDAHTGHLLTVPGDHRH